MKKKLLILTAAATMLASTGCETYNKMADGYKKTGNWAPNGFSYTLQRDRVSGNQSDYFGLSWNLK